MRLSPEDGQPRYFPARQQQRSFDFREPDTACGTIPRSTVRAQSAISVLTRRGQLETARTLGWPSRAAGRPTCQTGGANGTPGGTVRSIPRPYPALHGHSRTFGQLSPNRDSASSLSDTLTSGRALRLCTAASPAWWMPKTAQMQTAPAEASTSHIYPTRPSADQHAIRFVGHDSRAGRRGATELHRTRLGQFSMAACVRTSSASRIGALPQRKRIARTLRMACTAKLEKASIRP